MNKIKLRRLLALILSLILSLTLAVSFCSCGTNTPVKANETESETEEKKLDEDGAYYSKEDVALYLYTYKKLPSNYITKTEAKKLGWEGGSVEKFAKGKAIGGDKFGNYEELLPKDAKYFECDIDTNGQDSRGAKRIIFSSDCEYVYYTEDHYKTFELIEKTE